jgi:4-amino-4-deoxy-L-arabinose transferase-like glycosyltransferase
VRPGAAAPANKIAGRRRIALSGLVVLASLTAGVLVPRLLLFPVPYLGPDETTYALIGRSLLEGSLPYQGAFDHKPAALYVPFALAQLVFGQSIIALRALSLAVAMLSFLLVVAIARQVRLSYVTAACLALLHALLTLGNQGAAALSEPILNVYLLGAIFLALRRSARWWTPLGLGMLTGLAIHTNYLAAPMAATICLISLWHHRRHPREWFLVAAGIALLSALVLVPIWIWSDIGEYFRLQFDFLRSYHDDRAWLDWIQAAMKMAQPMLVILALNGILGLVGTRSTWNRAVPWYAATCVGIASILAGGHFYPHYSILLAPPLVTLLAVQLSSMSGRAPAMALVAVAMAAITSLMPQLPQLAHGARVVATQGSLHADRSSPHAQVVKQIKQITDPGDVIYSRQPLYYYLTGTAFPTRFVFPTHHSNEAYTRARGTTPAAEIREILGQNPVAVVMSRTKDAHLPLLWEYVEHQCRLSTTIKNTQVWDCRSASN